MNLWATLFCVWGPWEEYQKGSIGSSTGKDIGTYITQKRICNNCKMAQLRTVKSIISY